MDFSTSRLRYLPSNDSLIMPPIYHDDQAVDARNWPRSKRVLTTWTVSLFKFISGLTASSLVTNLASMAQEFHTPSGPLRVFPMSSYFLGYTVGLLLIAPCSEILGRVGMLQTSNMIFIIFNTAAGFSRSNQQIIIMRVLSGFGGAGPLSVRMLPVHGFLYEPLPVDFCSSWLTF